MKKQSATNTHQAVLQSIDRRYFNAESSLWLLWTNLDTNYKGRHCWILCFIRSPWMKWMQDRVHWKFPNLWKSGFNCWAVPVEYWFDCRSTWILLSYPTYPRISLFREKMSNPEYRKPGQIYQKPEFRVSTETRNNSDFFLSWTRNPDIFRVLSRNPEKFPSSGLSALFSNPEKIAIFQTISEFQPRTCPEPKLYKRRRHVN